VTFNLFNYDWDLFLWLNETRKTETGIETRELFLLYDIYFIW
jgi:hypothetical protein